MNVIERVKEVGVPLSSDAIQHCFSAGVYAKRIQFAAGQVAVSHVHRFDHLSILAAGRVRLIADGTTTEYAAPAEIVIQAGHEHALEAITDAVWYCVHATDETDAERIDAALIA